MATKPSTLWVVAGDFNWVTKDNDRFDMSSQLFTGKRDLTEELHWQDAVAKPGNLFEVAQAAYTFQAEGSRSRLDRVYTSHHTADFFEGSFWAGAWPWPQRDKMGWAVSDHRPVSFGHHRPVQQSRPPCLRQQHIRHPDFAKGWPENTTIRSNARSSGGRSWMPYTN